MIAERKRKRWTLELLQVLENEPLPGVSVCNVDVDEDTLEVEVQGPQGSVYEGGSFIVEFKFPASHPFSAPSIHFKTPIWHPNVRPNGSLSLEIIDFQFGPAFTLRFMLGAIQSILLAPDFGTEP